MSEPSAVLIDDDALVLAGWKLRADRVGRPLLTFSKYSDFVAAKENIPCHVPIFIDAHLSEVERGELRAKEMYEMGYETIYLVTGYPESAFPSMPWLKGILGKAPPSWLFH